jgi:hypothetical protein
MASVTLRTGPLVGIVWKGRHCAVAAGQKPAPRWAAPLGGVLRVGFHILDPPAQVVGEKPFLAGMGFM